VQPLSSRPKTKWVRTLEKKMIKVKLLRENAQKLSILLIREEKSLFLKNSWDYGNPFMLRLAEKKDQTAGRPSFRNSKLKTVQTNSR